MSNDRYDIYEDYDSSQSSGRRRNVEKSRQEAASAPVKNKKKPKKQKSLFARFVIMLLSVTMIVIVAFTALIAYSIFKTGTGDGEISNNPLDVIAEGVKSTLPELKERTVFLVIGTDEDGTRTDTILLCCYNSTLNELDIISIPRDTLVEVDEDTFNKMNEEWPEPGQRGMKINAVHHYGGKKYGVKLLEQQIEKMFGVKIDNYVKVSFEAFDYLVDSVGGIEYNVPMAMDYEDPYQNLAIHLKPGLQTLSGKQAEGLVRFRSGYSNADLGRIETQQAFMKILIKKLVNADTIFSNPKEYIYAFFKYVDTDVNVVDAVSYISVLKNFDSNNLYTYTLPGDIASDYGFKGAYGLYEEETKQLSYDIFQKPSEQIKIDRQNAINAEENTDKFDDTKLTMEVLNGGYTDGMASAVQKKLTNMGYNVPAIGTWTQNKAQKTRIYVREDGMGQDIKDFFSDTEIINDPEMTKEYDIVIIIGMGEYLAPE